MLKTFKTQIYPDAKAQEYIRKACGIRRWTWNWAVATFFEEAKHDKFPNEFSLKKQLNNTLVKEPEYYWLSEVNSMARAEALKDFSLSIKAYASARHAAKRTVEKLPVDKFKPSFKKKGKCTESFRIAKKGGTEFKVHSDHDFSVVTVKGHPRLHVYPHESVAFLKGADIKTCTFSIKGGRFFISICYEKTNLAAPKCGVGKVGIDLGIKHPLTAFDGSQDVVYDLPQTLTRAERRTERCNQRLAKSTKGSKRHDKLRLQLERAYMHEANIKKDWRDKITTQLIRDYGTIIIDDFGFEGAKNLHVNRALYRAGCYAFKITLESKAIASGAKVVYVPKGTPTTKTCSYCGNIQKMTPSDRVYTCPVCGLVMDRDANAAHNIYNYC